ncbi:MAG: hypothetical protein JNN31_06700 [Dechloromonas sp.]|nr:hypothetical protein [Dechloromonas sp.]
MTPLIAAFVAAMLMMAGALVGALLRKHLPSKHFGQETMEAIKLGLGFIATLSALVMGLVISSSKAAYDARAEMVHSAAALIVQFDSNLRQIGPEANPIRLVLKDAVVATMGEIWGRRSLVAGQPEAVVTKRRVGQLEQMLFALVVSSEMQRQAQANAFRLVAELARLNASAFTQHGSDVVMPLLAVVSCWMMLNVAGWNLFAPASRMLMAVNVVCALSVASAVFLILEMDQPFNGVISISDAPMRAALERLLE